jgi:hypothetical protein
MAVKLNSLSAKNISSAVEAAIKKNDKLKALKGPPSVAVIRPPIMGFILVDKDVRDTSMSELSGLARDVAGTLGSDKAAQAGVFSHGGHIIIGYVEEAAFSAIGE